MASPVDTSVKFFSSKMLGAPILRGQVGSLIAILDACLVNGWGVQVANTCVVSGGVCTMTFPLDHACPVDGVVLVAGASITALNGEQKVTAVAPNVIRFNTAAANGTATGTITAKMAALGFNKPFTGTNLAVYKSANVAGNGHFLRVNDTGATFARANGYENMTGISTGTGLFPTAAQLSGGHYWHKSEVANSTPITWLIYGDSRFFVLFTSVFMGNDLRYTNYESPGIAGFGDPIPYSRAADPFSTLAIGSDSGAVSNATPPNVLSGIAGAAYVSAARAIAGTGAAVPTRCQLMANPVASDNVFDPASGQVRFSGIFVNTDGTASWRAGLPGVHLSSSSNMEMAFANHQTFKAGTPEKSYLAVLASISVSSLNSMQLVALDITGPIR